MAVWTRGAGGERPLRLVRTGLFLSVALLVYLLGGLAGCARVPDADMEEEEELPLVEVDEPADAILDPSQDTPAESGGVELIGVLPGDYPQDLPVYTPSRLTDFGDVPGGGRFAVLRTANPVAVVRERCSRDFVDAGWSRQGEAASGEIYHKGGREVRIRYEPSSSETDIRIEW